MKKLLFLIISLSLELTGFSQGFNYQAVIRNSEGEPLANQPVLVQIDLEDQSGDIVYYSEFHEVTTSSMGIVNITVGSGDLIEGAFGDIPWSSNSVFMRILVDPSGAGSSYAEVGVTKIMSVPYALFAETGNEGPQGEMGPQGTQGEQGIPGEPGTPGIDGASSYQLWLDQGNAGTEEIFLASLIGNEGPEGVGITETIDNGTGTYTFVFSNGTQFTTSNLTGPQGLQGIQGLQGDPGVDGLDGLSAYEIWIAEGNVGSQSDFLLSLVGVAGADGVGIVNTIDNENGTFTFEYSDGSSFITSDLTGPKGDTGEKGEKGEDGAPGTGLQNRGNWVSGAIYNPSDYVFSESTANPSINSMWIVQSDVTFVSSQLPKNDLTNWVEFQAPPGPPGPVAEGTSGQTLSHNGTTWFANSLLYNDGTMIAIGHTDPTNILDITGSIRLRTGAALGRVLTSSSTGVATWEAPSYSNWSLDGNNIFNTNKASVVVNGLTTTGIQSPLVVRQTLNPISGSRVVLANLSADFRQNSTSDSWGTGIKFSVGNTSSYSGTAAIVAERTGSWSQGRLHFAVNDVGASGKTDIPIAMTIDGPSGGFVGIGTTKPTQRLEVAGNIKADGLMVTKQGDDADALFVVRNTAGKIVFAVYESGVRIFVDDNAKATRGGFAVGGLSDQTKADGVEYFRVTPDSVRITINTPVGGKATRGGFAVGGLSDQTKAPVLKNLLFIAPDSARIYTNSDLTKGTRGGFAVGGLSDQTKATSGLFMYLTPENYLIGQGAGKAITTGKYNSFIGYQAGEKITIGSENIFIGYRSGAVGLIGNWNTFLGFEAGLSNTGSDNTFIGYKAGRANRNKGGNVYLGSKAGELATYGEQNVFIGESTGRKTTYGKKNVFIGYRSGYNNTGSSTVAESASFNVFIGNESGYTNSTGFYNVFIGNQSGYSNSTGNFNAFVGFEAGRSNTTGNYNTFYGYQAGFSSGGSSYTTAIGYQAGYSLSSWQGGTYVGYEAGKNNTGRQNVLIGAGAGRGFTTAADNVAIGANAGGSNDSPFVELTGAKNTFVGYYTGYKAGTAANNVIVGAQDPFGATKITGSYNVYLGVDAGNQSASGSRNVFIGYNAGKNETGSNKLYIANSSTSPPLIYGDFTTGRMGLGTIAPAHKLHVVGNSYFDAGTVKILIEHPSSDPIIRPTTAAYGSLGTSTHYWYQTYTYSIYRYNEYTISDKRVKSDLKPIESSLVKIMRLKGYSFNYIKDAHPILAGKERDFENNNGEIGFVAQELMEVFPEMVVQDKETGFFMIRNQEQLLPVLVEAIKELKTENDDLKARLERLEKLMLER